MHYFEDPRHTQSMIEYFISSVFLEIPVKNCIVGMLLTCPITKSHYIAIHEHHDIRVHISLLPLHLFLTRGLFRG